MSEKDRNAKMKKAFIDWLSLATANEYQEICCPNCGSWVKMEDLRVEKDENMTCPLCHY